MINELIGDYRLIAKLGSGGFGSVYKGQHVRLQNRFVAIKIFKGNIDSEEERQQFMQEAPLLDTLRHPHILPVLDHGICTNIFDSKLPYLITEFVPAGSLYDQIKKIKDVLPFQRSLAILAQTGEALQFAHDHSVIHRDLKPGNILLGENDHVFLADFGLAVVSTSTFTKHGIFAGTLEYMAPEQFEGEANARSDQYALACMAYELFTGRLPFHASNHSHWFYQHMYIEPDAPSRINPALPLALDNIILRALAKDRHERFPSITTFMQALEQAFTSTPDRMITRTSRSSLTTSRAYKTITRPDKKPMSSHGIRQTPIKPTRRLSASPKRYQKRAPRVYMISEEDDDPLAFTYQFPEPINREAEYRLPYRYQRTKKRQSKNRARRPQRDIIEMKRIGSPSERPARLTATRTRRRAPAQPKQQPLLPKLRSWCSILAPPCFYLILLSVLQSSLTNMLEGLLALICVCMLGWSIVMAATSMYHESNQIWRFGCFFGLGSCASGLILTLSSHTAIPFFIMLIPLIILCSFYHWKTYKHGEVRLV